MLLVIFRTFFVRFFFVEPNQTLLSIGSGPASETPEMMDLLVAVKIVLLVIVVVVFEIAVTLGGVIVGAVSSSAVSGLLHEEVAHQRPADVQERFLEKEIFNVYLQSSYAA